MKDNPENLIIIKSDKTIIVPYDYSITGLGDIAIRAKAEKRAFAHGGTLAGDGYIDFKTIKINIDIKETTQEEHDSAVNELLSMFRGRDYKLMNERNDSYYNVASMSKTSQQWQKGFKNRWSTIDITLLLTDPFRYSTEQKTIEVIQVSEGTQMVEIENLGAETPLVFEFWPNSDMPKISVEHEQTGNSFTLSDSLLVLPKHVTVDTKTGRVLRNGLDNAVNAFDGQFLTLSEGANTYNITSKPGTIKIIYLERFLI